MKVGIHDDILAAMPGLDPRLLGLALRRFVNRPAYQSTILTAGSPRCDLEGSACGAVTQAEVERRQERRRAASLSQEREHAMPTINLAARAIKLTIPLSAAELLDVHCPEGAPSRITLRIRTTDRTLTADVAAKAIRKAQALVREHGAEACFVMVQGKLASGDQIAEAGLVAQIKAKKIEEAA